MQSAQAASVRRDYLLSAAVICLFLALLVVLTGYLWAHPYAVTIMFCEAR